MKSTRARLCAAVLVLCMLVLCLPAGAAAPNAESTLSIFYKNGEDFIAGAEFSVYRIAELTDYPTLRPCENYEKLPVDYGDMTEDEWDELALTLKGYALRDNLTPDASGYTDENGELVLEGLKNGLYLVLGGNCAKGRTVYTCEPFFILLPGYNAANDEWNPEVSAFPKSAASDDGDGDYVSRRVLKVWTDDNDPDRPKDIVVDLLRDGVVYDSVILNDENEWHYEWNKLSRRSDWIVVERDTPGYTSKLSLQTTTFTLQNSGSDPKSPPDKPPDENLPQTGLLWWPVPMMTAFGLLFILIGILRRRKS